MLVEPCLAWSSLAAASSADRNEWWFVEVRESDSPHLAPDLADGADLPMPGGGGDRQRHGGPCHAVEMQDDRGTHTRGWVEFGAGNPYIVIVRDDGSRPAALARACRSAMSSSTFRPRVGIGIHPSQ